MNMAEQNRKRRGEDVSPGKKSTLDLQAVKATIQQTRGPEYWRSLEELAGSPEFQEMMHREFPRALRSGWIRCRGADF